MSKGFLDILYQELAELEKIRPPIRKSPIIDRFIREVKRDIRTEERKDKTSDTGK